VTVRVQACQIYIYMCSSSLVCACAVRVCGSLHAEVPAVTQPHAHVLFCGSEHDTNVSAQVRATHTCTHSFCASGDGRMQGRFAPRYHSAIG
jgi:hypothetical protein